MAVPAVNLRPCIEATEREWRSRLDELFARSHFILGEQVRQFEEAFARHHGARFAIGVANGTAAIELCLRDLEAGGRGSDHDSANRSVHRHRHPGGRLQAALRRRGSGDAAARSGGRREPGREEDGRRGSGAPLRAALRPRRVPQAGTAGCAGCLPGARRLLPGTSSHGLFPLRRL